MRRSRRAPVGRRHDGSPATIAAAVSAKRIRGFGGAEVIRVQRRDIHVAIHRWRDTKKTSICMISELYFSVSLIFLKGTKSKSTDKL